MMAMSGMNGVLRGQGAAKATTAVLLLFSATNWVLDPLLITGMFGIEGFGVAGAAYATIGGWIIAIVTAAWLIGRHDLPIRPSAMRADRMGEGITALVRVAGPAAFTNSINPAGLAVLTSLLAAESAAAVAGFGVGGRLQGFAVVPLLALSGSIGAIVGQNWGAGQHDRAREALVKAGLFCLAYGLAAAVAIYVGRDWFARLFSEEDEVTASATAYLALSVWGYAGFGVLIVVNGALNAIDRAGHALALSLARVLLLMVPVAWLLRPIMGAQAIYMADLVANLAGGLAGAAIAWWVLWRRPSQAPNGV